MQYLPFLIWLLLLSKVNLKFTHALDLSKVHSFLLKVKVLVLLSCLDFCNIMDCSLSGFSVPGILQAEILEWVAMPFSKGSSPPRDQTGFPNYKQILYHLNLFHGNFKETDITQFLCLPFDEHLTCFNFWLLQRKLLEKSMYT